MSRIANALGIRPKPYRILTMDGGGVRGIIPLIWLERLEQHIGAPAYTHFDMVAGTSIGAIIGCAISSGMRASEIIAIWKDCARTAFAAPVGMSGKARRIAAIGGLVPKYPDAGLITMLEFVFGERLMSELSVRPTLALSYNPDTSRVYVFSNTLPEHGELRIADVCRASTAAPLFFSPSEIEQAGRVTPMLDGGITANNPVIMAITHAVERSRAGGREMPLDQVVVASFGTGRPADTLSQPRSIWGHGSVILRALYHGAVGTDHVTAQAMLPAENYWRFQTSIPARLEPMDRTENIDELAAIAQAHLADGADHRLLMLARRLDGAQSESRWRPSA